MTWPMQDFSLANQLALYGATAGCVLVVLAVVGTFVILARFLIRSGRRRWSSKL